MEYLREHPPTQAGAITCPSCKEEIIPRISMPTPASKEKAKKLCRVSESRCLAVAGTAAVALLILIVYFTVGHR
jgi:hypothetical protein